MDNREKLRAETTDLLQRLRADLSVSQVLFDLLDVMIRRLDRLELGEFDAPDEVPTVPGKRPSVEMAAVREEAPLGERVKHILDEGKKK
jgi:hypothetical protein